LCRHPSDACPQIEADRSGQGASEHSSFSVVITNTNINISISSPGSTIIVSLPLITASPLAKPICSTSSALCEGSHSIRCPTCLLPVVPATQPFTFPPNSPSTPPSSPPAPVVVNSTKSLSSSPTATSTAAASQIEIAIDPYQLPARVYM